MLFFFNLKWLSVYVCFAWMDRSWLWDQNSSDLAVRSDLFWSGFFYLTEFDNDTVVTLKFDASMYDAKARVHWPIVEYY